MYSIDYEDTNTIKVKLDIDSLCHTYDNESTDKNLLLQVSVIL